MPELQKRVLDQEQMTDYLWELKTGDRILSVMGDDETSHIVVFKKPTRQDDMEGKVFYASLYNSLLEQGVPTRAECRRKFLLKLQELGVDSGDYEKRRDELHTKIAKQLQENMDEEKAKDILTSIPSLLKAMDEQIRTLDKDEMTLLRTMADVEQMENQMLAVSAEVIADSEGQLFMVARLSHKPDGSLYWPTPEAMNEETDASFMLRLREEYTRWRQGFPLLFEVVAPTRETVPNTSPSL